MSVGEVQARVDEIAGRHADGRTVVPTVGLTGGEPLLQEEIYPVAEKVSTAGYTVLGETSGERSIARLPKEVIKIVDVKCPDSGEADTFLDSNLEALGPQGEVKL